MALPLDLDQQLKWTDAAGVKKTNRNFRRALALKTQLPAT
jgi:hypothetical protein